MDDRLTLAGIFGDGRRQIIPLMEKAVVGTADTEIGRVLGQVLHERLAGFRAHLTRLRRIGAAARDAFAPRPRRQATAHALLTHDIGHPEQGFSSLTFAGARLLGHSTAVARKFGDGAVSGKIATPKPTKAADAGRVALTNSIERAYSSARIRHAEISEDNEERTGKGRQMSGMASGPTRVPTGGGVSAGRLKVEMISANQATSGLAVSGGIAARGPGSLTPVAPGVSSPVLEHSKATRVEHTARDRARKAWQSAQALTLRANTQLQRAAPSAGRIRLVDTSQDLPRSAAAPEAVDLRPAPNAAGTRGAGTATTTGSHASAPERGGAAAGLDAAHRSDAQIETNVPRQGDVFLDGALMGRWMARTLAREAGRAPSGGAAFDPRRSPLPTGRMIGG